MNPRTVYAGKAPVCLGGAVTACVALIPRMRGFAIFGLILGPMVAVWFGNRARRETMDASDGANIGFRSVFYGLLAASTIYDVIWHVFGYQLWRLENLDRLVRWVGEMMRDAISPVSWIVITIQIIVAAICAGAFGASAGALTARFLGDRHR